MKLFRLLVVLGLLVCAAPLLSVVIAGTVANRYGCTLHEGFANPCIIGGTDWGETLYTMGVMGWLMLATLPIGAGLLLFWLVVEVARWVRVRRRVRDA